MMCLDGLLGWRVRKMEGPGWPQPTSLSEAVSRLSSSGCRKASLARATSLKPFENPWESKQNIRSHIKST